MKTNLLLSILIVLFGWNANAQWTSTNTGLSNLSAIPMAVSGSNIFVGTYGSGVFLSTNDGASWTAVNNGLTTLDIFSLTIQGTTVYAGTYGGGVFRSTNNGTSWTAVNNGITNLSIYALESVGTTVFAGTTGGGVYASSDNGVTWNTVNTGLTNLTIVTLYESNGDLYAGSVGAGAFVSSNNGQNWTAINTGLTNLTVRSFVKNGTNLFAGTAGGGIFLSTNNGTSWTAVNTGLTNLTVWTFTVYGSSVFAGTNGGGVFQTSNNGTSWSDVSIGMPASADVWAVRIKGTNIFSALNGDGVYVRPLSELVVVTDASFNYSAAAYCADATNPLPAVIATPGGVFTSMPGLIINQSTGEIDLMTSTPGTYTITYTVNGVSSDETVTINDVDDASFTYSAAAFCLYDSDPTPTSVASAGGTFSSTAGIVINTSTGEIDLNASTSGLYTVTYTTAGVCPSSSDETVTINDFDDASFTYSAAVFCLNDSDPMPTSVASAGGTFSSTAGIIINSSTGEIDLTASTPGVYTVTYTTAGPCSNSSDVNLELSSVDATTSVSGLTITSNAVGATYQWLDCDNGMSEIVGETSSSYTATANGNYAVEVTSNSCVDTSTCVAVTTVGLTENDFAGNFTVYPNPTDGALTIEFESNQEKLFINVYSISGALVQSKNVLNSQMVQLVVNEPAGIYILEVSDEKDNKEMVRLVKK